MSGNGMGRPSDYSEELAAEICGRLANGESLKSICSSDAKPDASTVYRWLVAHETFREMYARAREDQADTLADEILSIADKAEDANLARLQVDARKWVAAKLKPRKYGERVDHTHAGPDGGSIQSEVRVVFDRPAS